MAKAKKAKHIAVAGNIGAGKTTLTEQLSKHYRWIPQFEDVDHNPYLSDFYDDMPRRIRRAHLVICRAGASTVSELAAIGAPSILVPLPGALDADQLNNTRELASKGGCWVMPQPLFLAGRLAAKIESLKSPT